MKRKGSPLEHETIKKPYPLFGTGVYVTTYESIEQNTPEWLDIRNEMDLNSSSILDYIGASVVGKKKTRETDLYDPKSKVVLKRKNEWIEAPPSEFLQRIFQDGHEGEAKVKELIPEIKTWPYAVVSFTGDIEFSVGVSLDGYVLYKGIYVPVEIKSRSRTCKSKWSGPALTHKHQMMWQAITTGSEWATLIRYEETCMIGTIYQLDTVQYITDFKQAMLDIHENVLIKSPEELVKFDKYILSSVDGIHSYCEGVDECEYMLYSLLEYIK